MTPQSARRLSILFSAVVALASAMIGWHSADGLETLWDEAVDHDIAVDLMRHPLTGGEPTLDASQMRLPMYVNAIAFAVTGRADLHTARAVSLIFGAVTILTTGALARACFGPLVACLSVLLLGFSPYFISFARISMTEGDVFFACFATLGLWAFIRYLRDRSGTNWLLAAILIGLAIGSKLFAGYLLIVGGVMVMAAGRAEPPAAIPQAAKLTRLLAAMMIVLAATAITAVFSASAAAIGWFIAAVLWAYTLANVRKMRDMPGSMLRQYAALVVFSLATWCVLMPVHITDHQIAREILRRLLRWDDSFPLSLWDDHLRLYSGILLIKLTIPLGIISAAALVYAAFRERDDGRWRACVLSFVFYVVIICLLPLRQSFYLMGIYPAIMILTAGLIVEVAAWLRRRSRAAEIGWCVVVVAFLVHFGWSAARSYPHYQLHGYEQIGDRWLGAESRGYRNLIQTPSDGVESLIRWCVEGSRVKRGDRVVSYLWEKRIIDDCLPAEPHFEFIPRGVTPESDAVPPPPPIEDADYVLVHINNLLGYGDLPPDWPPEEVLAWRFEVIHTIRRGPLAVAWVYGRKE